MIWYDWHSQIMFLTNNKNYIQFAAVGFSLLFSLWAIYIDPVINNDGILYVLLADTIKEGNYSDAFSIFRWPFYSFFIAGLSQLTGFSSELSAYLLNTCLAVIIITSFISIIRLLGGDQRIIVVAVIVILLFPGINRYRSFISRDFGYLAFYVLSAFIFFKHIIKPEWYWPVTWTALLAVAALFRIEAIVLLICLPFISWFVFAESKEQRIKIGAMFGLVIAGSFVVFAWWFAGSYLDSTSLSEADGVFGLVKKFLVVSISEYSVRLEQMQTLLTHYSRNYAQILLFLALIIIIFGGLIQSVTLPYIALLAYGTRKYFLLNENRIKNAWLLLVLINFLILSGAAFKYFFTTGRFPLALSLTVLIAIPFILSSIYQERKDAGKNKVANRWFFPVITTLIILVSLQGLNTFTAKTHYKEGGLWIKRNINPDEKLLSTDIVVTYYAGRNPYKRRKTDAWTGIQAYEREDVINILRENKGKNYQYIAVSIKEKYKEQEKEITSLMGEPPAIRFKNNLGDELLIFSKKKSGA